MRRARVQRVTRIAVAVIAVAVLAWAGHKAAVGYLAYREFTAGETCFRARDYAGATRHFEAFCGWHPTWDSSKTYLLAAQREAQRAQESDGQPVEPLATDLRKSMGRAFAANDLNHEGQFQQAIASAQDAARLNPWSGYAHDQMARAYHDLGQDEYAVTEATQALECQPTNKALRFSLGCWLGNAGQADGAAAQFGELVRQEPGNLLFRCDLARALGDQQRYEDAKEHYLYCLAVNPNDDRARRGFAYALARLDRHAAAAAQYRECLRHKPKNDAARADLGQCLSSLGEHDEAIRELWRALDIRPNALSRAMLGTALARAGRYHEALAEYRRAWDMGETGYMTLWGIGLNQVRTGRTADGLKRLREAVEMAPRDAELRSALAWSLYSAGKSTEGAREYHVATRLAPHDATNPGGMGTAEWADRMTYDRGLSFLRDAVRTGPDDLQWRLDLAGALVHAGKFEDAAVQYREAIRIDPYDEQGYWGLGACRRAQGREAEAADALWKAFDIAPDNRTVSALLLRSLRATHKSATLMPWLQARVAASPKDVDAQWMLADCLWDEGDIDGALAGFERVGGLGEDSAWLRCDIGITLDRLGRTAEAVAQLQYSLSLDPRETRTYWVLDRLARSGQVRGPILGQTRTAADIITQDVRVRTNLAQTLAHLGYDQEALTLARSTVWMGSGDAEAHYALACAMQHNAREAEIAAEYRKALSLGSQDAGLLDSLGYHLGRLSDHEHAFEAYRQAVALRPSDTELRLALADELRALGRRDEAFAENWRVVDQHPGYEWGWERVAWHLAREASKLPDVEAELRTSLADDPEHYGRRLALAALLLGRRRMPESFEIVRSLMQERPDDEHTANIVWDWGGDVGERDRAIMGEIRRELQAEPRSADLYVMLGTALHWQYRDDEAAAAFRTALNLEPRSALARDRLVNALYYARRYAEAVHEAEAMGDAADPGFLALLRERAAGGH